jgi:hypothetical protein
MWLYSDIVKTDKKGKLNLCMTFQHGAGGGVWTVNYRLRKREGKFANLFNITAPDRETPRNLHKLDKVMSVIKFAAFSDRYNTTGNVDLKTFKRRLAEVIGAEESNRIANLFIDTIKNHLLQKA